MATVAATAVFGFSILAGISTSSSAREQDEVKTFKLTRGKLQITTSLISKSPLWCASEIRSSRPDVNILRSIGSFVCQIETCS